MGREFRFSHVVRTDLAAFHGYASAHTTGLAGHIWLHANESAYPNPTDPAGALRRYPHPQPPSLVHLLSSLYGCRSDQLLIGRGSDECIDLLVRSVCTPKQDAILVTPPVFAMYAVAARLQMATVIEIPLRDETHGFVIDPAAIVAAARAQSTKLIFLCSPSNPTGGLIALESIQWIAEHVADCTLVVVDEAYLEFSDQPSAVALLATWQNIVVLRTVSKAHALAGARIGCCIAHPDLIALLRCCQAPYPVSTPARLIVEKALAPVTMAKTLQQIRQIIDERSHLADALSSLPCVRRVYPSYANFLLVRFYEIQRALMALLDHGVVVRDQRTAPQLADALRITIGTQKQQKTLLVALEALKGGV